MRRQRYRKSAFQKEGYKKTGETGYRLTGQGIIGFAAGDVF